MRNSGSIVVACAWAALAAFAADPGGPQLGYDHAVFADDCLAPDFRGSACALLLRSGGEEAAPSASAALLPGDVPDAPPREPLAPRLGYAVAELLMMDGDVGYR